MALKRITAPANDPVTLAEAKSHLRVDSSDDDTLIALLIDAAVSHIDGPRGFLGRALIDQTWDYYLDEFPSDSSGDLPIKLPLPPLIEVVGVYYEDSAGDEQTFAAASYVVDTASEPGRISLIDTASWPTPRDAANAVRIRFRAGYQDTASPPADDVPAAIKQAILLRVGDLYHNRETMVIGQTVATLSWTAEQLLRPFRHYLSLA